MAEPGLGDRGCAGIGRHIANRLLADGEQVVDVLSRVSARAGVSTTGQGRKTDATDALGRPGRHLDDRAAAGGQRRAARDPADPGRPPPRPRRGAHPDGQLHQLLLELIPGGAKKDLSARQAKALLAKVRPRDAAGRTRRVVPAELIGDLERIYARKKAANEEFTELLGATGTGLLGPPGIGPSGAARLLVEVAGRGPVGQTGKRR